MNRIASVCPHCIEWFRCVRMFVSFVPFYGYILSLKLENVNIKITYFREKYKLTFHYYKSKIRCINIER
nr:MAG TPA: hypothetical protein [Caudoviricetes sp.]